MQGIVECAARLIRVGRRAYERKWTFLGVSVFVFFLSVLALAALDLLPDPPAATPAAPQVVVDAVANMPVPAVVVEEPVKIEIPAISLASTIANPATTDIETLDKLLLKGAVRYPTSAELGETGNIVLFGHSSYLPIVGNQAYKTFDGIQKLVAGDDILLYSADAVHTYRVRSVSKESAEGDAGIPLSVTGKVLTLVTCNSFATKSDRFVVTADFVESHSLPL